MLRGYRTYILAGVGVIAAVANYLVGDVSITEAINQAATAAALIFLRKAI